MVAIPDLSRLSGDEKDALILALLERLEVAERRIAELEAKLNEPPKTPDNSSVPPSRGEKSNTPNRATRRDRRDGPGTARRLAAAPDRTVSFKASHCPHCAAGLDQDAQTVRAVYDRIEVPEIRPMSPAFICSAAPARAAPARSPPPPNRGWSRARRSAGRSRRW